MNVLFQGMIMTPLERITQLVNINGDVNDPDTLRPLLSLEDFLAAIISSVRYVAM